VAQRTRRGVLILLDQDFYALIGKIARWENRSRLAVIRSLLTLGMQAYEQLSISLRSTEPTDAETNPDHHTEG